MQKLTTLTGITCFCFLFLARPALSQGTAFTYQGNLGANGSAANGTYDFQFTVYASSNSGVVQAGPLTITGVGVTNGLFMTAMDFGPGVFGANSNWLAVAVRTNGAGAFTTLTPRQAVTASPYAIYAANAAVAASATTAATASSVPAGNVSSGTLSDSRLSSNVALRSGGNTFTNNQNIMGGRLGVGTNNPGADLHVMGSTAFATEMLESSDTYGSWLRLKSDTTGGKDWDIISTGPGVIEGAGHFLFYDPTADAVRLDLAPNGHVGVGTYRPTADFHVFGTTSFNTETIESPSGGGTWLRITNGSSGGRGWDLIATGSANFEGAGKFLIHDTLWGTRILVDTNGNVGIGTITPASPLDVAGEIRSSSNVRVNSTNYAVGISESNIRIVRGAVNYDGTLGNGAGFTVTHPATGIYNVTFTQPFSLYPIVTITPFLNESGTATAQFGALTSNGFTVGTKDTQIARDLTFTFIAIGN